jgi:TRAP-type C4-dicarboxylate transport system, periplasmic component
MSEFGMRGLRRLVAVALVASGALMATGADAAEKMRIRVATQYAKGHPALTALNQFKERVESATGKRIAINIFPANQLGDYTQVYEELRRGTIDMGLISVPSQFDPRLEVTYVHYLASTYPEARKIYAPGSYLWKTVEKLHGDLGVKFLGLNVEGFGGLGLTKKPDNLTDPTAPKNILLRVPPMDVFKLTADEEGFRTVTVPFAELYTALQTGVADGWSGGPPVVNYLQFRDVIKYFLVNNNFFENTAYLMSGKVWDKLSAEDRTVIQNAVNDLAAASFDVAQKADEENLKKMSDAGIEVIRLNENQLKSWATQSREKTWPKLADRLSAELINGLRAQY